MTQAIQKTDHFTEITPFGSKDKIKLSVEMVKRLVAVKTKTGRTCSDDDAVKFIAMCSARHLNPFEGDAYLIGYDNRDKPDEPKFSLITAHQAFLKRAELNPEYDGMKSGLIIRRDGQVVEVEGDFYSPPDEELLGGWAIVHFKNRKFPMHKRVRLKTFAKNYGVWLDNPAGMICKCAEADALRSAFPTMLGGLYLKEELPNQEELKVTTPIFTEVPKDAKPAKAEVIVEPPPPKASEPEPAATFQRSSECSLMAVNLKKEKVSEAQVMQFLTDLGTVDRDIKSLDELEQREPETFTMLKEQLSDICERIKTP